MKSKVNLLVLFFLTVMFSSSTERVLCFQTNSLPEKDTENNKYHGRFISTVEFEGNKNFSSRELLAVFDFNDDIAGKVNSLFVYPYKTKTTEHFLKHSIKEFLNNRGYARAEVGNTKIIEDGIFIKLIVPVNEGMIYRIGKITVSGNKEISSEEIKNFLGFEREQVYSVNLLHERAFKELPKFCGSKGFAKCDVDADNFQERENPKNPDERIVDFDIFIDEGKKYRFGQITISGTADNKTVRSLLTINEGEIFNRSKIDDSLKKLKESGLFEEIDFDKDVEFKVEKNAANEEKNFRNVETKEGIIYRVRLQNDTETEVKKEDTISVHFTVNKRKPDKNYYLGSVKFIGNETISDDELRRFFGFQKNSYFDVRNFVEKVKAFNQTGKFKPIVEDDIDFEIGSEGKEDNEISEQINITIKLFESDKVPLSKQ